MLLVHATATRRAWRYFSPFEVFFQLICCVGAGLPLGLALWRRHTFMAHRTPLVILARFSQAVAPSTALLYVLVFDTKSNLGARWSNNPFGILGFLLFNSRVRKPDFARQKSVTLAVFLAGEICFSLGRERWHSLECVTGGKKGESGRERGGGNKINFSEAL